MLKQTQGLALADERASIYAALENGADPSKLASELASKHPEQDAIVAFVDTVLAEVWLDTGAPIADVLTVLEARHRFELPMATCRAYALGILTALALSHENDSIPISNLKESHHAVA